MSRTTAVICQSGSMGQQQMVYLMYPPNHVIQLAGYLRHHFEDMDVHVVDGYDKTVDDTVAAIASHEPDILFLQGDTPTATAMYAIADGVKRGAPAGRAPLVVLFGEHVSALPEEPFARSAGDVVMLGDPEPVAHAICLAVMNGTGFDAVDNVVYRTSDHDVVRTQRITRTQRLDELPPAARDLIDVAKYRGTFYKKSGSETSVLAGRGCPWVCTFCGPAGRWAMDVPTFRHRSPKSLVDELESVQKTYGIDDFLLIINTFNFNPNWAKDVCREIIGRGLKVNLKTHLRADRLSPELLDLMRRAGFWLVYLGIESANDRTLRGVKKELTVAQIERALVEIHRAGIKIVGELMNCLFWEEDGELVHEGFLDAWRTLRFARRMYRRGLLHAMYWTAMMPLPASESYQVALRHGLIDERVKGQWHLWFPIQYPIVRLPGMTKLEWYAIQWLGKFQQLAFLLGSRLLHPARAGMIAKRALQLFASTASNLVLRLRARPASQR